MDENETEKPAKKQQSSLFKAFGYAFEGIAFTIRTQKNMRIHLVIAALALIASVLLRLHFLEFAVIIICIGLVLGTEMLNTALESLVDLISPQFHPSAKLAKDIAAGIVLIFAIVSAVVGCIIFVMAILRLIG